MVLVLSTVLNVFHEFLMNKSTEIPWATEAGAQGKETSFKTMFVAFVHSSGLERKDWRARSPASAPQLGRLTRSPVGEASLALDWFDLQRDRFRQQQLVRDRDPSPKGRDRAPVA